VQAGELPILLGTTAVAYGVYGKGRVLCYSPHPELTEGLAKLVRFAIHSVARRAVDRPVKIEADK
jgi:hypothetical protein